MIIDHRVSAKDVTYANGQHNTKYIDQPKADNANAKKPYLRLPRIGTVRMMRPLRYEGRPVSVTIRQHNERFYACFLVEVTEEEFYRQHPRYKVKPHGAVGIDLGTKELAVTSDGIVVENPNTWERQLEHDNRLQERMNRCKYTKSDKGKRGHASPGQRFLKAKMKLWRLRTKVRNQREDLRNKLCAAVLATNQHIGIETLQVKTMGDTMVSKKGKKTMHKRVRDVSLYEIRHRLETLGELLGRNIVAAPKDYPSTRRCCKCGHVVPPLSIMQRIYHCPKCGNEIDRDLNAAINLRQITGRGTSGSMPEASTMRSELIKSNIPHSVIGNGKQVGTRS
jgi:putative transposase